jgi:hypothetical protein
MAGFYDRADGLAAYMGVQVLGESELARQSGYSHYEVLEREKAFRAAVDREDWVYQMPLLVRCSLFRQWMAAVWFWPRVSALADRETLFGMAGCLDAEV